MLGIQIKIADEWIILPEDFSISIEQTNPLFNDQGIFSFPFEIPLTPNRPLFKNIAHPRGDTTLKDIDHQPAEVWFNGIMMYRGFVETDDTVEFSEEEDTIPISFKAGNSDFMEQLGKINARQVPLNQEINLGYVVSKGAFSFQLEDGKYQWDFNFSLPEHITMEYANYNVKDAYPIKPYCNVRVCTGNNIGTYSKLEAKRPFSGVCFYVRYFLDCLWQYMNLSVADDRMKEIEDMNRLAFFTTQCHVTYKEPRELTREELFRFIQGGGENHIFHLNAEIYVQKKFPGQDAYSKEKLWQTIGKYNLKYKAQDLYATSENFPDVTAKEIIEDLQNAFGLRFIYGDRDKRLRIVMLKDVFRNKEVRQLYAEVLDLSLEREKHTEVQFSYGETDDTAFNYTDYSDVLECKDYAEILKIGVSRYDKRCFIDQTTGNAYRIKVNKDTGGDPSLFEVGGFRDYFTHPEEENKDAQSISLSFKPVLVNDISRHFETKGENQQLLAVFADVELKSTNTYSGTIFDGYAAVNRLGEIGGINPSLAKYIVRAEVKMETDGCQENFDTEGDNEAPLRSYDAGYTMGIMRGPGNESGIEYSSNYDGEGNDSWVQTVGNYAFTSDSCDNYGRFFDYNGQEVGGADQDGRFSLKLVAKKDKYPIGKAYSGRGLVSKFQSEYLYFLSHRKVVTLTTRMNISHLINIDLLKRYQIGNLTGFINRISYTLHTDGISEVKIEIYTL